MHLPPRRFIPAFVISAIASLTAVALALLPIILPPTVSYRPDVAVLTATLIAIIWYTYLTYVSVHREETTRLAVDISAQYMPESFTVRVRNASVRTAIAVVRVDVWVVGKSVVVEQAVSGMQDYAVLIDPQNMWAYEVSLGAAIEVRRDEYGDVLYEADVVVRVSIGWRDDLGDTGQVPERWFKVEGHRTVMPITSAAGLKATHEQLGGGIPAALAPVPHRLPGWL